MVHITNNEGAHHAQSIERFLNEIKWRKNHKRFENVMIVYYHRNNLDRTERIIVTYIQVLSLSILNFQLYKLFSLTFLYIEVDFLSTYFIIIHMHRELTMETDTVL